MEMPLLMGSPIGGYLRLRPPHTWSGQTERRSMGSPMVDSRWELAPSVRFPWLGAAQADQFNTHWSPGDGASDTDRWVPSWPVFDKYRWPGPTWGITDRPTDPLVPSALWIPPCPRNRGWGVNAQIPQRAPLPKRSRLGRDRLSEQPDERFGWTPPPPPPRGIGLREYIANRRSVIPYDFVMFCFTKIK